MVLPSGLNATLLTEELWQPEKGTFLDGKVFEIWHSENITNYLNNNDRHVIIAIYPHAESAKQAAEFYKDWMGLFCYRSKISWAYWQSRLVKESLLNHYKQIEENRKITNPSNSRQEKQNITTSRKICTLSQILLVR